MTEDRSGLDALRRAIDAVARDVERAAPRGRPAPLRRAVLLAAAALLVAAAGWGAYRLANRPQPDLGVRVTLVTLDGKPAAARVIDPRGAGAILVVPERRTTPTRAALAAGGTR